MAGNPLTLLIVEDQKFSTDLFKAAFPEHHIIVSHTGQQGLENYQQFQPNITFLDIGLPDITGFDVLAKIRILNPDAYIVMLSGMNNDIYIKRCRELGAQGFLGKPYAKENIQYYIDLYVNRTAA